MARTTTLSRALSLLSLATAYLPYLVSATEDVLYSQRMSKRFIDDDGNYNISFYHVNDVHSHLDEFSSSGTDCTRPERGCYGGYARVKAVLDETRPDHNDSLLLNAGDEFQGTLFYTFYGGEKIAETLNQIGFDAMTIGNHEFDGGDDELGDFLQNLTFPIVCANIQSDNEKLNKTIQPYHVFDNYQLAVIGVTTETIPSISSPGKGTTFSDAVEAVQNTVDLIRNTTNITRIAALTHIGYKEDIRLAKETTGLYLIMGGHSHTLLGDMEDAEGPYPTIEENKDGEEVFIVTAYRWGEYLGYIDVMYDAEGKVLAYHGAPIHLTNTTAQDEDLQAEIESWRGPFEEFAAQEVGISNVELDQIKCQEEECYLGDFICDAMLQYRLNASSEVAFAITNAGGIRATIDSGPITRGEVLTAFPFGNAIVELTYSGEDLLKIMEGLVSRVSQFNTDEITSFFQVSKGVKVEYNPDNDVGHRLVALTIGDDAVDPESEYTIVTIDFLAGGGDNFFEPVENLVILDTLDEVLVQYIQAQSPIDFELDGRIAAVSGQASSTSGGGSTPTQTGSDSQATETDNSAGRMVGADMSFILVVSAIIMIAAVVY